MDLRLVTFNVTIDHEVLSWPHVKSPVPPKDAPLGGGCRGSQAVAIVTFNVTSVHEVFALTASEVPTAHVHVSIRSVAALRSCTPLAVLMHEPGRG